METPVASAPVVPMEAHHPSTAASTPEERRHRSRIPLRIILFAVFVTTAGVLGPRLGEIVVHGFGRIATVAPRARETTTEVYVGDVTGQIEVRF